MRFCIPTDLQTHFKRKQFKVSLKSVNYKDSKRLSLYLNDFIKEIYKDLRMCYGSVEIPKNKGSFIIG